MCYRYLNYDVVKMRKGKAFEGDNLLMDPTATTHLETLWAEDKSRSVGLSSSDAVVTSTDTSRSTTSFSSNTSSNTSNTTIAITTTAASVVSSTDAHSGSVRRRRSLDYNRGKIRRKRAVDELSNNIPQNSGPVSDIVPLLSTNRLRYQSNERSTTTLCAKRKFCEDMLAQSEDSVAIMDKIYVLLSQ